jgi:hypothetical protein
MLYLIGRHSFSKATTRRLTIASQPPIPGQPCAPRAHWHPKSETHSAPKIRNLPFQKSGPATSSIRDLTSNVRSFAQLWTFNAHSITGAPHHLAIHRLATPATPPALHSSPPPPHRPTSSRRRSLGLAQFVTRRLDQLASYASEPIAHVGKRVAARANRDYKIRAFGFQF